MSDIRSAQNVAVKDKLTNDKLQVDSDRDAHVKAKVWDGTNEVTVTDDRLDVNAFFSEDDDIFLGAKGKYISAHLLNGNPPWTLIKSSMNVNGSVTPVSFYRGPPAGKKWYIGYMVVTFEDESINHVKFAGISALTNGVQFKVTENGSERDLYEHTFKTTGSFYHAVTSHTLESARTDIFTALWNFREAGTIIKLKNSTGDNIKMIVNDNLTSINFFEVTIFGFEVDE
ncbi:MAG: hypothetical protein ACTSR2_02535 [Candidatus Hodarchaeales archaeon]